MEYVYLPIIEGNFLYIPVKIAPNCANFVAHCLHFGARISGLTITKTKHTHKNAMICYWCIEILVKCQSRDSISLTGSKDSYLCWIALHAWFPVNNCCYWYRSCIVITSQRNKLVQSISLFMNFCLFNVLMRFIQKLRITVDCV